jgi:hypothetical protein
MVTIRISLSQFVDLQSVQTINTIMKITKISLIALIASFTFSSCSSETEENKEEITEYKETLTDTEVVDEVTPEVAEVIPEDADLDQEILFKIDLIIGNNITGPSKVISEVKNQGIGRFQEILTIPMRQVRSFEGSSVAKGLALGALGVDVTYLSVNDRPDLALKYIASINKLNLDLDCGMVIDADAIDAFDEAKEDGEKMSELMYNQYFMMEQHLKTNAKLEVAAHIMVGGVIESLYISAAQLMDAELTEDVVDLLYSQKQIISDLLDIYNDMEGDESIIDELMEVQTVFEKSSSDFTNADLELLHEIVKDFHDEIAE